MPEDNKFDTDPSFDVSEEVEIETEDTDPEYEAEFPVSSEPEIIAQLPTEETKGASELPLTESPEEFHLASTVCECCQELNLTQKQHIIKCERCEQAFCFHFASNIDARYCVNCMSDVSVTKQVITKEYIHRDEKEHITSIYRRKAREVKITGLSWLFAQRKLYELSDIEMDLAIEYHDNLLKLMIAEQERRRNAKMHRHAGMKVQAHIPSPSGTTVTSSTQTTVKKTRTISKNKAQEQLNALLASMLGKGKSMADIAALLKEGK